jgi:hypothetical protein
MVRGPGPAQNPDDLRAVRAAFGDFAVIADRRCSFRPVNFLGRLTFMLRSCRTQLRCPQRATIT